MTLDDSVASSTEIPLARNADDRKHERCRYRTERAAESMTIESSYISIEPLFFLSFLLSSRAFVARATNKRNSVCGKQTEFRLCELLFHVTGSIVAIQSALSVHSALADVNLAHC